MSAATALGRRAAAATLLAAGSLGAQQPAAQRPAPGEERSVFVALAGRDTFSVERVRRTPAEVVDEFHGIALQGARITVRLTLAPGQLVSRVVTEQWAPGAAASAPPAARLTATFVGDSLFQEVEQGGQVVQRQRTAVAAGALPWVNPVFGLLDQIVRRARAVGGDRVTVPVQQVGGGSAFAATVTRLGADSVVADMGGGVAFRLAVGADGGITGGRIPAQGILIVRLDSLAEGAGRTAAAPPDYSAPPGAPYVAEEVTVRTPAGHVLAGTFTRPVPRRVTKEPARLPAVVLVTGSGSQDRDSAIPSIEGYRPFRQIADTLGRRGIAVLRLDDRGVGGSGGGQTAPTSADFADDIRAAVAWLRARPDVDPRRVAIAGHSEGAMIAPMVAETDSTLGAIALLAGAARTGREISMAQRRWAMDRMMPNASAAARDSIFRLRQAESDSLAPGTPWVGFWYTHDPAATARRVRRVPVLILQGETDRQVPAAEARLLAAAFRAGGNRDVTVRVFPETNHLFVPDPTGDWESYAALPSKAVPPAVLGALADWLAAKLRAPAR